MLVLKNCHTPVLSEVNCYARFSNSKQLLILASFCSQMTTDVKRLSIFRLSNFFIVFVLQKSIIFTKIALGDNDHIATQYGYPFQYNNDYDGWTDRRRCIYYAIHAISLLNLKIFQDTHQVLESLSVDCYGLANHTLLHCTGLHRSSRNSRLFVTYHC